MSILVLILIIGFYALPKIKIAENLNDSLQEAKEFEELSPFLEKGRRALIFSVDISRFDQDYYRIDSLGNFLSHQLFFEFSNLIDSLQYQSDVDGEMFADYIHKNMYLFLEEGDYALLDSLIQPKALIAVLAKNKRKLLSTQSIGTSDFIAKDPLGFMPLALRNVRGSVDLDDIVQNQGLYLSSDKSKLLLQTQVRFDPNDVEKIKDFSKKASAFQSKWNQKNERNQIEFFGTVLIVEANADQIKKDIILTVNIALIFIVALLLFYYRNLLTIFLFIVPGVLGITAALSCVFFIQGEISALALSASAVIMGIVVDYSFHFFSHLSAEKDPVKTRNNIAAPLLISSATTIVAFYSLTFAHSKALQDFGLFTSLSLAFTLLSILFILPGIINFFGKRGSSSEGRKMNQLIERFNKERKRSYKFGFLLFIGLFVFLLFQARNVEFESDLNKLNYYPKALKEREIALQNINPDIEKRITLVASGADLDEAIFYNRQLFNELNESSWSASIINMGTIGGFVIPKSEALLKKQRWNKFWQNRAADLQEDFASACDGVRLNSGGFWQFTDWISEPAQDVNQLAFIQSFKSLNSLIVQDKRANVVSSLLVKREDYTDIRSELAAIDGVHVVDGQSVATSMVDAIKKDFNLLLLIASLTVFVVMLLVYGRIELTLISFLPMVISWIWIMGLAGLFGIKFNFINIMIATIIFGLGDDFSIFITDGLQSRYKYKSKVLATHKAGIILSSISTIIGTGVLFFGQHPALRSIAIVSVIGISTIVLVSFVIQPVLYRLLILNRVEKGKPPYTLVELFLSFLAFSFFLVGSVFITIITAMVMVIPFLPTRKKKWITHKLIQILLGALIDGMFLVKKRYYDLDLLDFSKPSIIIANHSSFLDILAMAMRNPKIVILVGDWVYNSPVFGWFIRYADYIPSFKPIEESIDKIDKLMRDGHSVVIFPEAHRSENGKIRRFHKGAFYLAEQLKVDITPILIHGVFYVLPKHEYFVKSSYINIKVLPRISWDDQRFGEGYSTRTKEISKYFKAEFASFSDEMQRTDFYEYPIKYAYLYKGPVLEWYFRIKYKFEKPIYELVDEAIGHRKEILDLGCGYGFLSFYLGLRNENRAIKSYDFDEQKVKIAANSYLATDQYSFSVGDIRTVEMGNPEAIVLLDVLHYFQPEDQLKVLDKCALALKENGVILLKDALAENAEKHAWTVKSEKWSTKWLRFNKTSSELSFFTFAFIQDWAKKSGFSVKIIYEAEKSSNALLLLQKEN